jgi:hypothetical protein
MRDRHPCGIETTMRGESRWAMTAIGMFLFFGAIMAFLAGTTLIWQGTFLDHLWTLNTPAYKQLSPFGRTVGVPFLVLSVSLTVAGAGWFGRRLWGWRLTVVIIATQVLGDLVNVLRGDVVKGAIGFTIAGGLLFYLLRSEVRAAFASGDMTSVRS